MLGLKMATDPRWVSVVSKNLEEILVDHAFCEQKLQVLPFQLLFNILNIQI